MPAVSLETLRAIFGEAQIGGTGKRNPVVVVEVDQLPQFQVAGETRRFRGNTFHQVAVADDGVSKVIDDLESRPIVARRQMSFGHRQADAIAEPLAQRPCGGFHAGRQLAFRMTWSEAAPLAKLFKLLEGKVVSSQKKHAVEQHGAVAGRQDKTITIPPLRIPRIVLEKARPESIGGRR